jgi:hypothetical protein
VRCNAIQSKKSGDAGVAETTHISLVSNKIKCNLMHVRKGGATTINS